MERPQRSGREEHRSGRTTLTGSCPSGRLEVSMDGAGGLRITTAGDTAVGEFQREKVFKKPTSTPEGHPSPQDGEVLEQLVLQKV